MKYIKLLLGLILFAVIIVAGYYANSKLSFVNWFGVITAVVSPFAFYFLISFFTDDTSKLFMDLKKVTEIEEKIKEAKTTEEKLNSLQKQFDNLQALIVFRSRKYALESEKELLIDQGKEIIKKIKNVQKGIENLANEKSQIPEELKPLMREIDSVKPDDIVFKVGKRFVVFKKNSFEMVPLYGGFLYLFIRIFSKKINKLDSIAEISTNK